MAYIDENIRKELENIFKNINSNEKIKLVFFKENINCQMCPHVESLLTELKEITDKLELEVYNRVTDEEKAKEYGVEMTPAIFVETQKTGKRVVFYGSPIGYEFISLIEAIKNSVKENIEFDSDLIKKIKSVNKDINIKVFVTPTCPYCPSQVVLAHKLAMLNDKIKACMIEAQEFPELSVKYKVEGVPKTVINDTVELVGAQPESEFIDKLISI